MKNLREVNDDILKEWLEFREETILCYLNEEDKKHGLFIDEISEKISWLCSTDHSTSVSSGLLRSVTAGLHIQDRQCGNPAKWYRRQCT